jgi:hypothetical protein
MCRMHIKLPLDSGALSASLGGSLRPRLLNPQDYFQRQLHRHRHQDAGVAGVQPRTPLEVL